MVRTYTPGYANVGVWCTAVLAVQAIPHVEKKGTRSKPNLLC